MGSGNTYVATVVNRYYGPPDPVVPIAEQHPILTFNLFYPDEDVAGPMPDAGWPVVMFSELSGYFAETLRTTVSDPQIPQQKILDKGMALAYALLPVARGANMVPPTPTDQSSLPFDPVALQWGAAYRGNGAMVEANGNVSAWPGPVPLNYDTTHPTRPHPWLDPKWLNSSKAAMWLTQHLRYHGIGGAGSSQLKINPSRIGCFGQSAAANSFLWPAYQPDRAGLTGDSSGQGQVSTRLQAGAFRQATFHWLTFSFTKPPVGYMFSVDDISAPYDWEDVAAQMGDATFNTRGTCAADFYGTAETEVPGITTTNNAFPAWWSSDTAMDPAVQAVASNLRYVGTNAQGLEPAPHSVYQAYRAKSVFPGGVRLVVESPAIVDATAPNAADLVLTSGLVDDAYEDMAKFLASKLVPAGSPPPWPIIESTSVVTRGKRNIHMPLAGSFPKYSGEFPIPASDFPLLGVGGGATGGRFIQYRIEEDTAGAEFERIGYRGLNSVEPEDLTDE